MYVQLTENCNMACAHCCVSSSKYIKGKTMSRGIAEALIDLCFNFGQTLALGGGEPTLHPEFFEILDYSLSGDDSENYVWLATNGKQTKKTKKLLRIYWGFEAEAEVTGDLSRLSIELSRDEYHEEISPEIIRYFENIGEPTRFGNTAIRNGASREVSDAGFAKENMIATTSDCCCSTLMFMADGRIKFCGCDDAPVITKLEHPSQVEDLEPFCGDLLQLQHSAGCHLKLDTEQTGELNEIIGSLQKL